MLQLSGSAAAALSEGEVHENIVIELSLSWLSLGMWKKKYKHDN